MPWTYIQALGELLTPKGSLLGIGYAGHGAGVNNPAFQAVHNVGPLPCGRYTIGPAYTHPKLGPLTMNLTPIYPANMFDRRDFRIHGDSMEHPGEASDGCVVMPRNVRQRVAESLDRVLIVEARPVARVVTA